jgi:long-chain acyl-CoA synthetase
MSPTLGARDADPSPVRSAYRSLPDAWAARVAERPEGAAVAYFDARVTTAKLDEDSDGLAVGLHELGTRRGDRVGVYLQNIPQYAIVLLALWKLGATAVILNPMYRQRELRRLIDDSEASGFICADSDVSDSLATLVGSSVRWVLSTSPLEYQSRNDPRVFGDTRRGPIAPQGDLLELIADYRGRRPERADLGPDDVALLTYTSGTTGPPKGAMNTHGNLLTVTSTFGQWVGLEAGDVVFAMAPFFHITGAVINAAVSLLADTTLVLIGRFHPEVALDAFVEHGVTFTIGSITAFNAMFQAPQLDRAHFATVKHLYSGGAPIPPATVERFEDRLGVYIHNGYGMTETSSAVIAVPAGVHAPVHKSSGTLSIGRTLPWVTARIVDPAGQAVPSGEQGELELSGPQVVPGYWRNPQATAATMPDGRLRTGDVAIIDEEGWVYLVDRLKDQINVSGYKVWPREVEDALYEHPAVREAAVVGEPDDYRGENVVGYVSLTAGAEVTPDELIAFARERLAAYKVPRRVIVVDDLPKTQTGKIRRNVLRDGNASTG